MLCVERSEDVHANHDAAVYMTDRACIHYAKPCGSGVSSGLYGLPRGGTQRLVGPLFHGGW